MGNVEATIAHSGDKMSDKIVNVSAPFLWSDVGEPSARFFRFPAIIYSRVKIKCHFGVYFNSHL